MKVERGFRVAIAGIVVFFCAAMFLTWRATETPPPLEPRVAPVVEARPEPPLPALPPPAALEGPPPPPVTGPPRLAGPRVAPAPAATPWPDVPVVARVTALGDLGGPLHAGLDAARDRMEYCFEDERRRLDRSPPPRSPPGDPPGGPASLVLRLETGPGIIEVVDTEVDYLATSTPELVECCRQALKAVEIPAASAVPGRRYRMKYLLQ